MKRTRTQHHLNCSTKRYTRNAWKSVARQSVEWPTLSGFSVDFALLARHNPQRSGEPVALKSRRFPPGSPKPIAYFKRSHLSANPFSQTDGCLMEAKSVVGLTAQKENYR